MPCPAGTQAVEEKSTGVATIVDVLAPSGTSTSPPAAANWGSASRSSGDWMGAQNNSGSAAKGLGPFVERLGGEDLVELDDQAGCVVAAPAGGGVALVCEPVGPFDRPGEGAQ